MRRTDEEKETGANKYNPVTEGRNFTHFFIGKKNTGTNGLACGALLYLPNKPGVISQAQ